MTEEARGEGPSGALPEADVPRLGIRHLMLWTACCGLFLGIERALFVGDDGSFSRFQSPVYVWHCVYNGAALTACLLWVPWKRAGIRFPSEPGEWLLILAAVFFVVSFGTRAILASPLQLYWPIGESVATCWLFLVPFCLARAPNRWETAFALFLARDILVVLAIIVFSWGIELDYGQIWFPICVLSLVVALDLKSRTRYRWTHWVGVSFYLLHLLVAAAQRAIH